jgi:hypothetical protein
MCLECVGPFFFFLKKKNAHRPLADQGYLHQPVCWESLVDVEGSGDLCDGVRLR